MIEKYNDESYDGVVLKLPSWFIEMNDLGEALEEFKDKLAKSDKSIHLPDFKNSIYELNNRLNKKDFIKSEKNKNKEKVEKENIRNNNLENENMFHVKMKRMISNVLDENITLNGKDYFYDSKWYGSDFGNSKSKFLKELKEFVITNGLEKVLPITERNYKFKKLAKYELTRFYINKHDDFNISHNVLHYFKYSNFPKGLGRWIPLDKEELKDYNIRGCFMYKK